MCESILNMSTELLACRVCLVTDKKLYNLYQYQLVESYENLSQTKMSEYDGLPQHICTYCCALLQKCAAFKERCRSAQELLKYAVMQEQVLTMDYIRAIDRNLQNLDLPYTSQIIVDITNIKEESSQTIDNAIKSENTDSEEEPLSTIKTLYKKRKKNENPTEFETISVKVEIDHMNQMNQFDDTDADFFDNVHQNFDQENQEIDMLDLNNEIDVIVLSKEEQIAELELRKKSLNYLNSFYKCDYCYKGFITDATYNNHMLKHDASSGSEICDVCHTRCADARTLRAHIATTHERKYVCKKCNHVSKSSHRAREHCKWHNGFTYTCKVCGASFAKSTSHLTHIRLHHPTNNCCDICGEYFLGENGLRMHKKKTHRDLRKMKKSEFDCLLCGTQFHSLDALNKHTDNMQDNICDPNIRPCVHCGDGFSNEGSLEEHLKGHRRDGVVKCEECNRTFAHERSFSSHYRRVHNEDVPKMRKRMYRGVVCEICGRTCISNATLLYHQRTHTGERPYQCPECPKRFSVQQRLQIHIRTHTGERPFKCAHCPKAFKHKAALNRHDRVHTGAKPYPCTHCGKTFSQSNSMKTHVRTVHLKLPAPYRNRRIKQHE